jgi:hypothetical protein
VIGWARQDDCPLATNTRGSEPYRWIPHAEDQAEDQGREGGVTLARSPPSAETWNVSERPKIDFLPFFPSASEGKQKWINQQND